MQRTTRGLRGAPSCSSVRVTATVDLHKGVVATIRRGVHHDVHRGRRVPAILRLPKAFPVVRRCCMCRPDTLCIRGCCAPTILCRLQTGGAHVSGRVNHYFGYENLKAEMRLKACQYATRTRTSARSGKVTDRT